MTETYYRLVDSQDGHNRPCISLIKYTVVSRTEKGAWIIPAVWYYSEPAKRFVLDGNGKRYAYPTFDQALNNYQRRKQRHIRILSVQHDNAVERLQIAGRLTEEMTANVYLQRDDTPPSIDRALRKLELNSVYPSVPVGERRFPVVDQAAAVTECGTEHLRDLISNPAIVIEPKPMRVKHDNPISPRTWTLD